MTKSNELHTYTLDEDTMSDALSHISVTMNISKQWDDDTLRPDDPCGAQYDGVLINDFDLTFQSWSAVMTFSGHVYIDSSWNGDFASEGNTVYFTAQGEPATVFAHSSRTFGAIMYSQDYMTLEKCVISGYSLVSPQDLWVFRALCILTFLWTTALIIRTVISIRIRRYRQRQELDSNIIMQSMNTFTGFIDAKDEYTKGHSIRVAEYASEIARRMKLENDQRTQLYYISLMHDCGKIGIPDAVLKKPGRLTDEEYKLIQSHTVRGDAILENFTAIPGIREGAHFHHERFDGKGYPTGISGNDIPLYARIICVADSYDAMSSNRCYRAHLNDEKIISELRDNAGRQFDPEIVPIMLDMIRDGFTRKVQAKYPNNPVAEVK